MKGKILQGAIMAKRGGVKFLQNLLQNSGPLLTIKIIILGRNSINNKQSPTSSVL
jgi:hypothetical protein